MAPKVAGVLCLPTDSPLVLPPRKDRTKRPGVSGVTVQAAGAPQNEGVLRRAQGTGLCQPWEQDS